VRRSYRLESPSSEEGQPTMEVFTSVLTALVAVYAAVVSTVLGVREIRREKRSLIVRCSMVSAPHPRGGTWELLAVSIVNSGHRPVQIDNVGLLSSQGHHIVQVGGSKVAGTKLPIRLGDGEGITEFIDVETLADKLNEDDSITAYRHVYVLDAEGREYRADLPDQIRNLSG
jgi:hypothetical protein